MKYDQKQNPLWLGILFGTAVYGSIVLAILSIINISIRVVLIIPLCIMFVFVLILQTRNISSAKKEEDVDYCLKTYFIYKYIMMPFELICAGIVGACILGIIKMIIHWPEDGLIATFFIFIIMLIFGAIISISMTTPFMLVTFGLIGLTCFTSIDFVLDITKKKYGMSSGKRVMHLLLQIIPVLDIIDGLYISIKYWNRGRGLAIVTAVFTFCVTALVLSFYLVNRF